MASIRARTKANGERVFHVQVRMTGFPARTASFPTRRQAERWSTTVQAQMIEGKHFREVEARRRTLGEAIDRYTAEELPKKRNGAMHRTMLPWWKLHAGRIKLADVTPVSISNLRSTLSREPFVRANAQSKRTTLKPGEHATGYTRKSATVNRYLSVISHVFTVARKEWHWMSHNPMDGVSKLRENKGRVRYLTTEERAALLEQTAKDPVLHTMVIVALSTACRAGELIKLTWRDVDLDEGRLLFRQTKNDEPRAAWLQGEALRAMTAHSNARRRRDADLLDSDRLDNERVFPSSTGRTGYDYHVAFKIAVAAASIQNFRFHDLRHSAATYLAMEGASEQQLRAIGGWKSAIVSRYVHLAAQDSREVMAKMNRKILG